MDLPAYAPENLRGRDARAPEFSPDGKYLVISRGGWNLPHDVVLVPIDGGPDRPLVEHPADDRFIAWTPGGNLLFRSDRSGTIDLWFARVEDGRIVGLPQVVKRNIGSFYSHGLTSSGTLYYQTPGPQPVVPGIREVDYANWRTDIYVATLDPSTGSLLSPPAAIAPTGAGRQFAPSWSSDGRFLIYRTSVPGSLISNSITLLSLDTGVERHVRPEGLPSLQSQGTWLSPDGRSLVVLSTTPPVQATHTNTPSPHLVDVATGSSTPIGGMIGFNLHLLPDGRSLAYLGPPSTNVATLLAVRDLQTAEDRVLYRAPEGSRMSGLAFTLDGKQAAFRQIAGDQARLTVLTVATGQTREVLRLPTTFAGGQKTAWSPDGRFIYFVEQGDPNPGSEELWRVAADGGSPAVRVLNVDGTISQPGIHPGGRHLVFMSAQEEPVRYFMLDRVLPDGEMAARSRASR
jgi:Tol biopolymer transport system component